MAVTQFAGLKQIRLTALLAVLFSISTIAFFGLSVAREIRELNIHTNGNAQWSLSQTEVEFLEFANAARAPEPDLDHLRLRYDVFYSRVAILKSSSAFETLRDKEPFVAELAKITAFLDETVAIIDSPDGQLRARLPDLIALTEQARSVIRRLAIVGLQRFTQEADIQRKAVTLTTAKLAAAIVALFASLALALFYLDRTNKRATERGHDLQRSAARMNTIIETALDGVIVTNEHFKIVEFSPAACDIFAISAPAAIGKPLVHFIDLFNDENETSNQELTLPQILMHRNRIKLTAKRADGTTFPAELAFDQATTADGHIYILFVRDISGRVTAEKQLVRARDIALENEQIKSDFLATMSHEIRTPLNGLLGNLDLLRDTGLSAPQLRYVQNMDTSGRMLMRHVSDVLDISQFDAGKMKIAPKVMHLPSLLDDILATQSGLASAQQTALAWDWVGPPTAWIKIDCDRLQHILMNLIGNAVKFTKQGTVTVSVSRYHEESQPFLRFEVADTGTGINADLLPKIFDDFVTGDSAYDRSVGGTGLGLGIAKRFAVGLGGTLEAQSAQGRGSTFTLRLPVTVASAPVPSDTSKTNTSVPAQRILVVEDNDINRTVVREMLEADGHFVTEAQNGQEGVSKAHAAHFDLILMDISMPVLDGREAARQIVCGEGKSARTPVVALTANVLVKEKVSFLAAGMVDMITKPVTREALRAVMRALRTPVDVPRDPLLDPVHLDETRTAVGPDAFATLSGRFSEEIATFLVWLEACPPHPLSEVADRAHKLAGTTALFGAKRLQAGLLQTETAAREDNSILVTKYQDVLPIIWQETAATLMAYQSDQARVDPASAAGHGKAATT